MGIGDHSELSGMGGYDATVRRGLVTGYGRVLESLGVHARDELHVPLLIELAEDHARNRFPLRDDLLMERAERLLATVVVSGPPVLVRAERGAGLAREAVYQRFLRPHLPKLMILTGPAAGEMRPRTLAQALIAIGNRCEGYTKLVTLDLPRNGSLVGHQPTGLARNLARLIESIRKADAVALKRSTPPRPPSRQILDDIGALAEDQSSPEERDVLLRFMRNFERRLERQE